jgi:hypothetical protein
MKMYDAAITFFTGSRPKFSFVDNGMRVLADGYYQAAGV